MGLEVASCISSHPQEASALAETLARKLLHDPYGSSIGVRGMVDEHILDWVRAGVDETLGGSEINATSTTLGRLSPEIALRLLLRGYVNTFVESIFLEPLKDNGEAEPLRSIEQRFKQLIPVP